MDVLHMNRSLGTKWFSFYTKFRPWLVCLVSMSVVADFFQYIEVYTSYWWMMLSFISSITQSVFAIMVFVKSRGDYIDFVSFVKKALMYETISMAYIQGVQRYIENDFSFSVAFVSAAILFVVAYFVWYRLNMKYFKNRIVSVVYTTDANEENDCVEVANETTDGFEDEKVQLFDTNTTFLNPVEVELGQDGMIICPQCGFKQKGDRVVCYNCEQPFSLPKDTVVLACVDVVPDNAMPAGDACQKCGNKLLKDSLFCGACGAPVEKLTPKIPRVMYCRKCGTKLLENSEFCHKCGSKTTLEEENLAAGRREALGNRNEVNIAKRKNPPTALLVVAAIILFVFILLIVLLINKETLLLKYVYDVELDTADPIALYVDDSYVLPFTKNPKNLSNARITWSSSNSDVVEVTEDGTIVAHSPGFATITVLIDGEVKDSCETEVSKRPAVYSMRKKPDEILVGDIFDFNYEIKGEPSPETNIKWEVKDNSIATIDEKGCLEANSEGTIIVNLIIDGIVQDSCTLHSFYKEVVVRNGEMIVAPENVNYPEVTIHGLPNENCFIYFKNVSTSKNDFAFYVKAGSSATVNAPVGTYSFYYAAGEKWYGKDLKFGKNTSYYFSPDRITLTEDDSYYDVLEITLFTMMSGNMETDEIKAADFPC